MNTIRFLSMIAVAGGLATGPALAQSAFDPATNTVCGLVNFAFCPQNPPVPVAGLPDPQGDAELAARPAPRPLPPPEAPVRRKHRKAARAATVPLATDQQ